MHRYRIAIHNISLNPCITSKVYEKQRISRTRLSPESPPSSSNHPSAGSDLILAFVLSGDVAHARQSNRVSSRDPELLGRFSNVGLALGERDGFEGNVHLFERETAVQRGATVLASVSCESG